MSSTVFTDGVTLVQSSWLNDVDLGVYSALTAVSGQNSIAATGPQTLTAYANGQAFRFIPVSTNTTSTQININSIGAKNVFWNGAACSGGELVQSVPTVIVYDGTQFNVVAPTIGSRLTNALSGDVSLSNTGQFFDGPTVSQGTVGTWFVFGQCLLSDTAGAANFVWKVWDGTTVIVSGANRIETANGATMAAFSGYITNPAASIKFSAKDLSSTSGKILFNGSSSSKDAILSAIRIG